MSTYFAPASHSFSMVNLINMMQEWDWAQFDKIMKQVGTRRVELVPGMLMGNGWDRKMDKVSLCTDLLKRLKDSYTISSIQSLTYGLSINLFDDLSSDHDVIQRFRSLAFAGNLLNSKIFVLGSPGQKKLRSPDLDTGKLKDQFVENCAFMTSILGLRSVLSLEHNTLAQGAEFCNTLRDITEVVLELKRIGIQNVGLNLDTKCLLDEFGNEANISQLIIQYELRSIVKSIQVSYDFLRRPGCQARSDELALLELARDLHCPVSLEEFGLLDDQLGDFIGSWETALSSSSPSFLAQTNDNYLMNSFS